LGYPKTALEAELEKVQFAISTVPTPHGLFTSVAGQSQRGRCP